MKEEMKKIAVNPLRTVVNPSEDAMLKAEELKWGFKDNQTSKTVFNKDLSIWSDFSEPVLLKKAEFEGNFKAETPMELIKRLNNPKTRNVIQKRAQKAKEKRGGEILEDGEINEEKISKALDLQAAERVQKRIEDLAYRWVKAWNEGPYSKMCSARIDFTKQKIIIGVLNSAGHVNYHEIDLNYYYDDSRLKQNSENWKTEEMNKDIARVNREKELREDPKVQEYINLAAKNAYNPLASFEIY
jgi:hypothetical protein